MRTYPRALGVVIGLYIFLCVVGIFGAAVLGQVVVVGDFSTSEKLEVSLYMGLAVSWLVISVVASVRPRRDLVAVAGVFNALAFIVGLCFVFCVTGQGILTVDALSRFFLISLPLGFAVIQILERFAKAPGTPGAGER